MTLTDIIHAIGTKTVLFTSSPGAFGASSLVRLGVLLRDHTIALAHQGPYSTNHLRKWNKKKKKNSSVVDTLIPFIYFVSERCISNRAKMPALPNVSQINDTQAKKGRVLGERPSQRQ